MSVMLDWEVPTKYKSAVQKGLVLMLVWLDKGKGFCFIAVFIFRVFGGRVWMDYWDCAGDHQTES